MSEPDWNAAAKLLRVDGDATNNNRLGRGLPVQDGTLRDLVGEVLAQPSTEHWRYSIVREGERLLDCIDIRTLAARADYAAGLRAAAG
jgi:hypothetical protein